MITIKSNGQIYVPEEDCFIGYSGDNLNVTKEFFVEAVSDISLIYRMFLKFDDGTCNYFLLDSEVQSGYTILTWNITKDHIFKDGIVQLQIKASNASGEVFHSAITNMIVNTSIEFTDYFSNKNNSEFLEYEETLNNIYRTQNQAKENAEQSLETANSTLAIANETLTAAQSALDSAQQVKSNVDEVFERIDEHVAIYENMNFDTAPTENSCVPVTSGGVYSALTNKINTENAGHLTPLYRYDSIDNVSTIYDAEIPSSFLDGSIGTTHGKVLNFSNGSQIFWTDDGRVFRRTVNTNDSFVQTIFTRDEIINRICDIGSGKLTATNSSGCSATYTYTRIENIIHAFVTVQINCSDIESVITFTNLPFSSSQGIGVNFIGLSSNNEPYHIKLDEEIITLTHLAQGNYTPAIITENDTLKFQITYSI